MESIAPHKFCYGEVDLEELFHLSGLDPDNIFPSYTPEDLAISNRDYETRVFQSADLDGSDQQAANFDANAQDLDQFFVDDSTTNYVTTSSEESDQISPESWPYSRLEIPTSLDLVDESATTLNLSAQTPDQLLVGNTDLWSSSIAHFSADSFRGSVEAWPHPALPASSCPGATTSSAKTNSVPLDVTIRDELVRTYFKYVHPLCPILDEHRFYQIYFEMGEEEFTSQFPPIMFNAMLFAAFAHAKQQLLISAGFYSVQEAQSVYLRVVKEAYYCSRFQVRTSIDDLILAKASLLLSLGCPTRLDIASNSLWIDRAINHTKRFMRRTKTFEHCGIRRRHDITYWCCVSRNAFISYVMRRPYRLLMNEEFLCDLDSLKYEFEGEVKHHDFSGSEATKIKMVEDFITMCKISRHLKSILQSHQSVLFQSQWNNGSGQGEAAESKECLKRYLEASKRELELEELVQEMEARRRMESLNWRNTGDEDDASDALLARVRSYTLSLITYSSIAALYQLTLFTSTKSWAGSCQQTALMRIKDASTRVAQFSKLLLAENSIEALPGSLLAWIVLPMTFLIVEQTCRCFEPSPSQALHLLTSIDDENDNGDAMESLLSLANALTPRWQNARDVCAMLQDIDVELRAGISPKESYHSLRYIRDVKEGKRKERGGGNAGAMSKGAVELLNQAVSVLDRCIVYSDSTL
ncbi:hypothetical protein DL95DRAFT_398304 [Leptodontidium sp. 2 PMI_412]|nr:hypothetical protein DL95DRAFT_398304 [Leptodontidium sp. 2 PMI_412]